MNSIINLVVYGIIVFILKNVFASFINSEYLANNAGKFLMSLPRIIMMILMAIPEQLVMYYNYPNINLFNRLLVSIAMYVIHFAWNGFVMKPTRSYNELVWIVGTALYAYNVIGVNKQTAIYLIAADSLMTLALRGL